MKKYSVLFAFFFVLCAFGEATEVVCDTDPSFAENTCEVCYREEIAYKAGSDGWKADITDLVIPWKHIGGKLDEIIYDNEQKLPEIKTALKVTTKPEKPEELWKNDDSLIWTPFSDHKEVFIKAGTSVGLYTMTDDSHIVIEGSKATDSALIVTPLVVRDFDSETNEDSAPKTRKICVLTAFEAELKPTEVEVSEAYTEEPIPTETPALDTPTEEPVTEEDTVTTEEAITTPAEEETPELNAAGPEIIATPEQAEPKTGPEMWIILTLALGIAGAWQMRKSYHA